MFGTQRSTTARRGHGNPWLRRRPRARAVAGVVLVSVTAVLAGLVPVVPHLRAETPAVVVYGDSLVVESGADLAARLSTLLPGWDVVIRAHGGTAQCDWHRTMAEDAATLDARVVVVAFSGNYLTPCITERDRVEGYTDDANWAVDLWAGHVGVRLLFVAAPGPVGTYPADNEVARAYRRVAEARGVPMVETDALFVDHASVTYTGTALPLTDEGSRDIPIRSPDERHFCPSGDYDGPACAEYSSGAVRYAEAITAGVADALGVPESDRHRPVRSRNEENHLQHDLADADRDGLRIG